MSRRVPDTLGRAPARAVAAILCVAILTAVVLAVPLAALGQTPAKVPRIGVIGERSSSDPFLVAFRSGLRDLGYVEGRSIAIEYRYLQGVVDRAPGLVAEFLRLQVDVLVVGGSAAARAARAATTTVPIVFTLVGDPVGSGLVASLARPGGNVTGMANLTTELSGKQLELLKTAAPLVSRVSVLYNPGTPLAGVTLAGAREAARTLGVELQVLEVRRPQELAGAFSALTAWRAGAVLALSDPVFGNVLKEFSRLAVTNRLPAMYGRKEFAEVGGLLAYGPNFLDNYRHAASYVDRILKGARPGDLPVEQPTRLELVINLRTARDLGLTIPPSLLGRADRVIQ